MNGLSYRHTRYASYLGYITQAIVNNFAPLLFVTFQQSFQIPLSQITTLITANFLIQLAVDLLASKFVDRIGYRPCVVAAHFLSAAGIAGLAVFPSLFASPYGGLFAAMALYAVGGGLLEVLISPIVEACPTENKSAAMSLLHSFYCWGHAGVVILSTVFFSLAGIGSWRILAFLWALAPLCNAFFFSRVPIATLTENGESLSFRRLFSSKLFWIFALLMVCSGASEQALSQWSSAFAESGLSVSKTVGDLAGTCVFALLMGLSRLFYARKSGSISLLPFMVGSGVLCIISYLLAALSPWPVLGLLGCGLCGLSVGILWPGTFSLASAAFPRGGTALFALLALAGDLGCSSGPTVTGLVAEAAQGRLQTGLLVALVFPVLLLVGLVLYSRMKKRPGV